MKERLKQSRILSDQEVLWPRRAKAFLGGGCLSYMLGLCKDFSNLDIFIEYDAEVFAFIAFMDIPSKTININNQSQRNSRIWVKHRENDDEISHMQQNSNVPNSKNSSFYSLPNPKIIFQNRNSKIVEIYEIYKLNPQLSIVKHWLKKYKHLPRVIFYKTQLELNEYTILKLITGFDLPILRYALAFKRAKAYHLRKHVLEHLYGIRHIDEIPNARKYVDKWQNDEQDEFLRKMSKITNFEEIFPKLRCNEYKMIRLGLCKDVRKRERYTKQQREMISIGWPYDSNPILNINDKTDGTKEKRRFKKYLGRLSNKITDGVGEETLPMQVYPLRYLAYWQIQKSIQNTEHNCLYNFNFCLKYDCIDMTGAVAPRH